MKQFLKIVEECDSKAYPPSRQIKQILSLDDVDNILTAPICRALSKAAANNAAKSFKLLFSQLNPEQKSALMGTQAIFSSLPILLDSATNHQFGNVDIISDLFRCMSTVKKARCLHRYLSNRIADTVNFSLASSILDVVDFYEAAIAREMVGGRFLQNEAFMTFARCADFLNLSSPHNREYAKSTPLNFAREIMRQTIVAVTNAIIPDGDDDSALSEEVKARRKYLAHIKGGNSTNHTRSLIHCATRKMGALIMDNLQQFRDGRNISIALEQAFHDPALDSKEPLSQAIQANKDIGALIFKAAMPNLEKIMPTDVIQWADFHPDSEVATSSPEAIAADIAKANKVMQEIYRDIKTEIFATSGRPTTSVNPAATATAAAPQNPSQATSAK